MHDSSASKFTGLRARMDQESPNRIPNIHQSPNPSPHIRTVDLKLNKDQVQIPGSRPNWPLLQEIPKSIMGWNRKMNKLNWDRDVMKLLRRKLHDFGPIRWSLRLHPSNASTKLKQEKWKMGRGRGNDSKVECLQRNRKSKIWPSKWGHK